MMKENMLGSPSTLLSLDVTAWMDCDRSILQYMQSLKRVECKAEYKYLTYGVHLSLYSFATVSIPPALATAT